MVAQQVFDLALQRGGAVAQDAGDLGLVGRERTGHAVLQQGHAFADGGQRRLQLVRDVAHEAGLVGFERGQALAQPVELMAQALDVDRAAHADGLVELVVAQTPDGRADAPHGPRQPPAEAEGKQRGQGQGADHQAADQLALLFQVGEQRVVAAVHLLLDALGQGFVGRVQAAEDGREQGQGGLARRVIEDVPRAFGLHRPFSEGLRFGRHGRGDDILRGSGLLPGGLVAIAQQAVVQHQELPCTALHGHRALGQALGALRQAHGIARRVAAFLGHVLQRQQGLHRRAAQQRGDHQEGDQQRLAERQAPQPAMGMG